MIDDKKLLCAFIYSAYESGYCGLMLAPEVKKQHMELYKEYIAGAEYYPEKEIDSTQEPMLSEIKKTSIREYIYSGHLRIVQSRIEEESGSSFEKAMSNPFAAVAAISCPVNLYKVIDVNKEYVVGRNLFSNQTINLIVLEGLENPSIGDMVSGHWKYYLENISGMEKLEEYKHAAQLYLQTTIKSIHEAKK